MDAKLEPLLVYGGLAVLAYLLIRSAKRQLTEEGGLLGSVEDVLVGAPADPVIVPIAPAPEGGSARGLFVRWIQPAPDGTANRPLFRRDYDAVIEIENLTGGTLSGLLEVSVEERSLFNAPTTVTTTAGPYTVRDRERRQVALALRTDTLIATIATATVRLAGRLAIPPQAQQYTIR